MKVHLKKFQNTLNKERGITLVALVITIVILIILATVAINATFGENGLIKRAEDAKEMTEEALKNEEQAIANVVEYMNEILGGAGGSGTDDPEVPEKSEVEEAIENSTEYGTTTPIKDEYENTVYVPGGFKLAEDSGTAVEEGIVIEDSTNGNQFVWIPVGTYTVSNELSKTGTLTNNLTRRTFTSSGATEITVSNGDGVIESYYYGEGDSRSIASGTIGAFKTNTTTKGGFYIGRYEQGANNVCKAGVEPYVNVTRDTANTQAKAMYNENSYVTSELISSYAWDTALNYICQTNSAGYLLATTTSSIYGNINTKNPTTTGEYEADKYSKICDFLGNRREWTTEYSNASGNPYVGRGSIYYNNTNCAAGRLYTSTSGSNDRLGFRIQLYVR